MPRLADLLGGRVANGTLSADVITRRAGIAGLDLDDSVDVVVDDDVRIGHECVPLSLSLAGTCARIEGTKTPPTRRGRGRTERRIALLPDAATSTDVSFVPRPASV